MHDEEKEEEEVKTMSQKCDHCSKTSTMKLVAWDSEETVVMWYFCDYPCVVKFLVEEDFVSAYADCNPDVWFE